MTRKSKRRHTTEWVEYDTSAPTLHERLADPLSKENLRRKAAQEERKKKSIYQKHLAEQKEAKRLQDLANRSEKRGPLYDKIKKLNKQKQAKAEEV